MPPNPGPCWEFFYQWPKENQHHHIAYCLGCIRHHRALKERLQWDEVAFSHSRTEIALKAGKKPRKPKNFFPRSLALLFGGQVANPVGKFHQKQFTREALIFSPRRRAMRKLMMGHSEINGY
ncbi:hypothetical protein GGX14DRAFT_390303 [Mycena pura]|uniref:Uncharacterized protein n=1 Tax=Mycena pura TaxID=153505 RepID=A0AAD6YGF6_9AGAR|nr:hypothetical protein GGX14DRAFT_390303 [Mycena pura]